MTDSTTLEPSPLESTVSRLRSLTKGWPDDLLDSRQPAFLCRPEPEGRATWYAIAHTARQAREVREYILAFVGPSYSDFHGQPAQWEHSDPVEAEFANTALNGFRFVVPSAEATTVTNLLTRLRQMLRDRPRRVPAESPSLARLLRDFELLIRAKNGPVAMAVLDQLRSRGQLTASQLSGLHMRWLSSQQRWADILASPELPALLFQRLPAGVAEAIAAAVYHEQLARFMAASDAAAHFREYVAPAYGQLFRQRATWRDADAVKAGQVADAAFRPLVPVLAPTDPYLTALAQRDSDPAVAFHWLVGGPFTCESVRLLIEVAVDLGSLETARLAVSAVRGCDAAIRESALARRASRSLWEELQDIAGGDDETGAPVQDWLSWLSRATSGPWQNAAEIAARGVKEWPRPDAAKFTAAFTDFVDQAFPALRDALPALLEMLLPDQQADPAYGSVYRKLLERVAFDDELSPNDTAAVLELAAAVLQSNPVAHANRNDYSLVIENLLFAWQQLKRPTLLDWGLDLLDLAAEHAVHRQTSVSQFVLDIVGEFVRVPRFVTSAQRELLKTLCAELEITGAADAVLAPKASADAVIADEAELRKRLGKQSVVLLTLGDRISAMFRTLMRQRFPDAHLEIAQEYAGTKRLRDLANSADVFIVNTFDAKHAATGFVSQHRPPKSVTLYPKGKNAAKQLDALEEWLRS